MQTNKNSFIEITIEIMGRVVLVCFYFWMLWGSCLSFLQNQQIGVLPYALLQALVIGFVMFRSPPVRLSFSPVDWLMALLPTLMPFFLVPIKDGGNMPGIILEYSGVIVLVWSVISLNSSLGIVAADRGIKTGGIYKLIRHPAFLGYMIANLGILLSNFSQHNLLFVAGGCLLQVVRIFREEKFLEQNKDYQDYKLQCRWRLAPGIW